METPVGVEVSGAAVGAFVGYLAVVVAIGVWAARFSSAGIGEFFIGGRAMGRFVVALSAVVSGRSAWLLLGFTGIAYTRGASAVWALVGYIAVEAVMFFTYGRRLRRFTGTYGCITLPDFFAARFEDRNGRLRMLLVLVILVFMAAYVSAQLVAGGKAFAGGFGLEERTGVLVTAGIVLAYTMLGGFLAVSVTDTLQAIIMLAALALLPALVAVDLGGAGHALELVRALDPALLDPWALGAGALIGFLGIGLGSPGNPHIVMRYMSIRDPEQLKAAAVIGTAWNVLLGAGALAVGVIGRAAFPEVGALPGGDAEVIFPFLAQSYLPALLYGVVMASIFAAIMSTADSQLLVGASSVVRDVYEKLLARGREVSQRRLVVISRCVVLALMFGALGFVAAAEAVVFTLVLVAWGGLGAALGPTTVLALYWRRTTRAGVMAGVIAGAATTILWVFSSDITAFLSEHIPAVVPGEVDLKAHMYELIPGFAAGLVATVLVSLLTRPPADLDAMMRAMRRPPAEGAAADR